MRGVKIEKIKSKFQFGNFENRGGGLNFSEMSELKVALKHHPKNEEKTPAFLVFFHAKNFFE